jgi:hypothetical protein
MEQNPLEVLAADTQIRADYGQNIVAADEATVLHFALGDPRASRQLVLAGGAGDEAHHGMS